MTKEEFIQNLNDIENEYGAELTSISAIRDTDYKVIEYVYTWHPVISNTNGKKEIAALYYMAGMGIIRNMKVEADQAHWLNDKIQNIQSKISKLQSDLDASRDDLKAIRERYANWNVA